MAATKTLKEITLNEIQEAFAKALSEIAGREYSVVLNGLQFDTAPMRSIFGEAASFTGQITAKPDHSGGDPF